MRKIGLKLITFDINNTLMFAKESMGSQYLRTAEIYCNQNLINCESNRNQTENQLLNAFKNVWKQMNKNYENYGLKNGMSSLDWWSKSVAETFRSANYSKNQISDTQMDLISKHLFKHYSSANSWRVDPNSYKVLSHLKKSNSKLIIGVISNFDERLDGILYETGLRDYFDFVLASRIAEHWKPSKEIFDLALKTANILNGSEALHIGDDFNLDYLSAKSFGWNAILYKQKSDLSPQQLSQINQNDIIYDLNELIDHKILK